MRVQVARVLRLTTALGMAATMLGGVPARADEPAVFDVGVAVRNIDPCDTCPQYLGGFGFGDPVGGADVHDPLEVRAMAIAHGTDMVLFAIVDSQGWFAGNQEGPWGNHDARVDAAKAIALDGYAVTEANIIVSSTHSHAAPSIMGIWGVTDPAYLQQVHDATVEALVDAATHLRPANLYVGNGDIATVTISALTQTDGYQGWRPDGDTPVLWARDPDSGATIGLYANVPTHADIVNGVGKHLISADHIGVERTLLDEHLGGTSVVAMGTLGRQETIVQVGGLEQAEYVGTFVTNEIERALATARPITDATIAAAEQYVLVPSTNPALVGLNVGNVAADLAAEQTGDPIGTHCVGDAICTIDRAIVPPYAAGEAFGTWFTAFRIGDVVYATEPGEAFPEVSTAIRRVFNGPTVNIVGMAQDQLGYYFPPETIPWTAVNDSDHHIYNASLLLGEANVNAHAINAALLGFTPTVTHETSQFDDVDAARHAGVQFFPVRREQADATFVFDTKTSSSALGDFSAGLLGSTGRPSVVAWDFGDDTTATTGQGLIPHTYATPGIYEVTASVVDPVSGGVVSWSQTVTYDPPLSASVAVAGDVLSASVAGGQGTILAAHWAFSDGSAADGVVVTRPAGASATVTVIDGAGNVATTTVP